ncbi:MAG: HEAT repeat domain-containing protein [Sulfurimonas sp.]|nr:HEAT repeat domain-containing protein [Sulfurimonas sp.]
MSETKQTISDFNLMSLKMSDLSSSQKFSLARVFDGESELMMQKLIDDDSSLDISTDTGAVRVSILAVLLENKNIKDDLRDKLISACQGSEDQEVKFRLARDPQTPLDIQKKLAKDSNGDIRAELIWRTPPFISILNTLSNDENWAIRREVSKSSYTTLEILESFINEDDDEVVLEVINNKNITPEILNKFAEKFFNQDGWFDENGDKYEVASNHKFIKALIQKVFEFHTDINELENNTILNSIANHNEELYRLLLTKHPDTPPALYQKLYREGDEFSPTHFSISTKSEEELLLKLAQDKNTLSLVLMNLSDRSFESVNICVAEHSNTLEMILKKLSFDESKKVRKAARDTLLSREQKAKSQAVSTTDLTDR